MEEFEYIYIDSGGRDIELYPNRATFKYELSSTIKNVTSVEILGCIMPNVNNVTELPYVVVDIKELNRSVAGALANIECIGILQMVSTPISCSGGNPNPTNQTLQCPTVTPIKVYEFPPVHSFVSMKAFGTVHLKNGATMLAQSLEFNLHLDINTSQWSASVSRMGDNIDITWSVDPGTGDISYVTALDATNTITLALVTIPLLSIDGGLTVETFSANLHLDKKIAERAPIQYTPSIPKLDKLTVALRSPVGSALDLGIDTQNVGVDMKHQVILALKIGRKSLRTV